jgi:hypothetical protein
MNDDKPRKQDTQLAGRANARVGRFASAARDPKAPPGRGGHFLAAVRP